MLSVRERGETVATLRWIHVRMMETLASWVPTTPEMEVKLLFGSHVWDMAQHADALGKRTFELRMPLQHSLEPSDDYKQMLADVSRLSDTAERLHVFYHGVLPALAARYRQYLAQTDTLLDEPTVRVLDHLAHEQSRMIRESEQLLAALPSITITDREAVGGFASRESSINYVVHRGEHAAATA